MAKNAQLLIDFEDSTASPDFHAGISSRGFSMSYSRLSLPSEYEFKWDGSCHYLAYHDLLLTDGEMEVTGERPISGRDLRGRMTYVPEGQQAVGWAKPTDRINAFTIICFDLKALEEEIQIEFNSFEPRPNIYFNDPELGAIMKKLGRLMVDQERPVSRIYAEAVSLTAVLEMLRISKTATIEVPTMGQLSSLQARMVSEYIEENLSDDLSLDELANVCGLTRFYFSRSFKATFGTSPYKYLTQRRIQKAQQMLARTMLSTAAIAAACGFNGTSQFGRTFKEITGYSPLQFRRRT